MMTQVVTHHRGAASTTTTLAPWGDQFRKIVRRTLALDGMTQERWQALSESRRQELRDTAGLTPELVALEGCRVEVIDNYGERRRFWVGRSTGWRPCHLEIARRNSSGGGSACKAYRSVVVIDRGPRR
jgi:hypothetical protein